MYRYWRGLYVILYIYIYICRGEIDTYCYSLMVMLNESVFDTRLMNNKSQDSLFCFTPIQRLSIDRLNLQLRRSMEVSLTMVYTVSRTIYSPVSRLLSVALYILKSGVAFQNYRPVFTYHYSDRTKHVVLRTRCFLRNCPLSFKNPRRDFLNTCRAHRHLRSQILIA